MIPCITGFWRFCFVGISLEFRWNFVGSLWQKVLPQDFVLPHLSSLGFRWGFVEVSLRLLLVCRLLDICSRKRSNLINHVMKLDRPLQPVQRCFKPPIATILFGGKMLWQSVLPQAKVR